MKKFFAILVFVLVASVASAEKVSTYKWQPEFDALRQGEYIVLRPDSEIPDNECRIYVAAKGFGPSLADVSAWASLVSREAEMRASLAPEFNPHALVGAAVKMVEDGEGEMDELTIIYVVYIKMGGAQAVRSGGAGDGAEHPALVSVEGQTFSCSPLG